MLIKESPYSYKRRGMVSYFICHSLDGVVNHGFSTKLPLLGHGSPDENISRQKQIFCDALNIDIRSLLQLHQTHGDRVFMTKEPVPGMNPGEYDAAVTNSPHIVLSILTADCLPILLYESQKKIIGAVHAGWRGTSLGILKKALGIIEKEFGGCLKDCLVFSGPCLGPCCFEIQDDVQKILQQNLSGWQDVIRPVNGRLYFDLQLANIIQAKEMGVADENIWSLGLCTYCNPGWFDSYRREKAQAGRMISIISLI